MMHNGLSQLRADLNALRRRRYVVRLGGALCATILAACALWTIAFLLDWRWRLPLGARVVVLFGWVLGMLWMVYKFVRPALHTRETLEELALRVERRHAIDSDLIAALQFDTAGDPLVGSRQLSSAVVEAAAIRASGLDIPSNWSDETRPRRWGWAMLAACGLAGAAVSAPQEIAAFWNRFWLGSARYPARTEIAQFQINGRSVSVRADSRSPLNLPQATTLSIEVHCQGEMPTIGTARLIHRASRAEMPFDLRPAADSPPGMLTGEHPQPATDFELHVTVGDTWVDPVPIHIAPLPIVDVSWKIIPPAYASASTPPTVPAGTRSFSVLPGSELQLSVRGINKDLQRVTLTLDDEVIPLAQDTEKIWRLPPDSPLLAVRTPGRFKIEAVDHDELPLSPAISGDIRLEIDHPPRVSSEMLTRVVVPTASPRLSYQVRDDYGIANVRAEFVIRRDNRDVSASHQVLKEWGETQPFPVLLEGELRLDLSAFRLQPGDELQVTVAADDARGEAASQTGRSETVILQVTDRAGVISELLESDRQTADRLDQIIQRQLGIAGEEP